MRHQLKAMQALFDARPNQWIPAYELVKIALNYTGRITELRKMGYNIINREIMVSGEIHSSYMNKTNDELFGDEVYNRNSGVRLAKEG